MKKNTLALGLITLIVIVILVGAFAISSRKNTTQEDDSNVTNLTQLKSSDYTNEDFDAIEMGDSKATVEEKMGTLTSVDIESEYDVYSYTDNSTQYYFYFDGDSLANVSIFLI